MLLAIDSSTQMTGLALYDGVRVLSEVVWQTRNHHTVELSPAINDLFERCGVRPSDLQVIGVALGPGSFTSLRIGLALAKGMAFALKIPLVGISTLDFLAAGIPLSDMPLAAVLQAGRGRLALVWYQTESGVWKAQGEPQMTTAEELAQQIERPTLIAGELNLTERQALGRRRKYAQIVSPARALRQPAFLAELAWERWKAGQVEDPVTLAPIYLHVAEPIPS